jgi:L-fucose isomerase-like protein/mRNA-degrading endonuclease YafQ of YafQ-DinJ toxin-antitoxin module
MVKRMRTFEVKPILLYGEYNRKEKVSWRPWGGIQSKADANKEAERIKEELKELEKKASFSLSFQSLTITCSVEEIRNLEVDADVILVYAAGAQEPATKDPLELLVSTAKPLLFFLRKDSGPVYLWYEILHPRFLRKNIFDEIVQPVSVEDVVVDDYDELLWRLRVLSALKSTQGETVISIGAPGGWGIGEDAVQRAVENWNLQVEVVTYQDLEKRIEEVHTDENALETAKTEAESYLSDDKVKLTTQKDFVINAFLLKAVLLEYLQKFNAEILTIGQCMSTIMPISETTACLPISILNDAGYIAFCESDFVVIPAGILLQRISGKPVFLVDPTFPHKGEVTVAHCTAPRRMDGKNLETTEITTHFESDYGAAPQVKMRKGQVVTVIDPAFSGKEWIGFKGKILDNPTLPICRSQIDLAIEGDWKKLLQEMKGFHWLIVYGDFLAEVGYAAKKVGVKWINLSQK